VFKQPDLDTLASRLVHVAKSEGKKLEVETAHVIANHGKGSYRDALGTLEQVLVQVKDIVKHEEVVAFLGLVDKDVAGKILVSVASCDKENFLKVMHELELSGVQPLSLYDICVELIRKSLLVRIGGVSDIEIVNSLAKNFPYFVSSKTVLVLLDKRRLIEVSSISCWTAFQAIFLELLETE
jgi:DNA polymerase III gamma/tau subunit